MADAESFPRRLGQATAFDAKGRRDRRRVQWLQQAEDTPGVGVLPVLASGSKCARCWQIYAVVDADGLCARCADAVAALAA